MKRLFPILFIPILSFLVFSGAKAGSASFYLSPPSGTYTVGANFNVAIKVNTGGEVVNAGEGTLFFNPSEVQIVSVSKSGSIFTLWTTEPTFSNTAGNLIFGGGTPANFSGTAGTILTITFKAKASASCQVSFSSGSLLAADGKGTNILAQMSGGVYIIKPVVTGPVVPKAPSEVEAPTAETAPAAPAGTPAAPNVSSRTHPEEDKWYSNNDPEFFWQAPVNVTAVKLLIGRLPTASPTVLYSPPISEKKLDDLADGIWYFHIQFKNAAGWGAITHRQVLIDTESPASFEIQVDDEGDPTNPSPILHFQTTDSLSGVEYYEVKVGEQEAKPFTDAFLKDNPYQLSPQPSGKYTAVVEAVDGAKNERVATTNLIIQAIERPLLTDIPSQLSTKDILMIKGTAKYPEATVGLFIKKEGEEPTTYNVKTDSQGNWFYRHHKNLETGTYQLWAQITDKRGAKSEPTEKIAFLVTLPPVFEFGKIATEYLSIVVPVMALFVVLIGIIFYGMYKLSSWRKKIKKETKEIKETVIQAFQALRREVQEQIERLNQKTRLTKGELAIRDKLQEALDDSEKLIKKEIRDIEKELK